ncbi:Panacea domain-containing protein [Shewanella sp. SP1S1-7]|uniref:Panacea domain-containing protein n=1 Tax=Shewanella sp. SP1S1-7 TaxID=3063536 RepID=UPI00288D819B|nr:Panacea domain-containing protein [Shewanella sp. SP1S1-7]MDT3337672.1 Panacea domain-containing protein [Shewanella sp. SP1S1-7]
MNKIQQIIAYICLHYPHPSELSKARLTKLVYLADWFSSLSDGEQMTDIEWVFNHYGPYVDDVVDAAQGRRGFRVDHEQTMYGTSKYVISFHGDEDDIELSDREKDILNAVMKKTKSMYFNEFVDFVYSTYPVRSRERYSTLKLVDLAKQYRAG